MQADPSIRNLIFGSNILLSLWSPNEFIEHSSDEHNGSSLIVCIAKMSTIGAMSSLHCFASIRYHEPQPNERHMHVSSWFAAAPMIDRARWLQAKIERSLNVWPRAR